MLRGVLVSVVAAGSALAGLAVGATPAMAVAAPINVVVPGTAGGDGHGGTPPVATPIVLGSNGAVVVTATGTVYLSALDVFGGLPNGPNGGNSTGSNPAGPGALVPSSPYGCLVARVGTGDWRCIGAGPTLLSGTGEVMLAVNDGLFGAGGVPGYADNSGQFAVTMVEGSIYPPDLPLRTTATLGSHHHHHHHR